MLTIKDINEVSFGKSGFSGYKPEDVDVFIDEVHTSFTQLLDEKDEDAKKIAVLGERNHEMQQKLGILAEKVESYRKDEDGIKEAIISAQKMAKISTKEAQDKARVILIDAEDQSKEIVNRAREESSKIALEYKNLAEDKRRELDEMQKQVSAFRVSLLEMYKKHLECINHIPSFRQKPVRDEKNSVKYSLEDKINFTEVDEHQVSLEDEINAGANHNSQVNEKM